MGEDTERREDLTLAGDAFMARVDGVLDPAYRLATVILLDYDAAERAVHDATLRAWDLYRRLGGEVTSFRTWFLGIVVRRSRWSRRWRTLTLRPGGRDLDGSPAMRAVLGQLPAVSRAALFCNVCLELPMDEVARILGMSLGRARTRAYRAGSKVQAALQREEESAP